MDTSFIFINIIAFLCFAMKFIAFCSAERSREMNVWIALLLDLALWSGGVLLMRLDVYPGYKTWFYVSLLALFCIAILVYSYVYEVADANRPVERHIWIFGTLIILAISATGFILEPPSKVVDSAGKISLAFSTDWKIFIPFVFFSAMELSTIRMYRRILENKSKSAPGVNELIIGCAIIAFGCLAQALPGNVFPCDALCGILFAVLISISIYKRRMFSTTLILSSGLLVALTSAVLALTASLFFSHLNDFLTRIKFNFTDTETETFILLSMLMFTAIGIFSKLLHIIFNAQEQQSSKIKKYSDYVSRTLIVDDILEETIRVILSQININKMYVCRRENDEFVSFYSTQHNDKGNIRISVDNPCVKYMNRGKNHIVLKEFETNPLYRAAWKDERDVFDEYGIVGICALKDNEKIIGLLLITEKAKGASYSYSDFSFLNTVCSVASMALKNAILYERVAEREHLFSSMTAYIPTVILIKQKNVPSFCFISANTEEVLGLPYEYFVTHTPPDALIENVGEEKANRIFSEFSNAPQSGYGFDIPFIRPDDNSERTIRCAFSKVISDGMVTHYVYVLSDISADIETRELLRSSVEIAQKSSRAKGEFLSHMSHEIRTPMNSIAGLTYLAREHLGESEDKVLTDYLEQIDQSSHYLLNLLNNIMDMSKIENQLYEIRKEPFEITKVIDEVCAIYSMQMQAKGVEFAHSVKGVKNKNLIGDEIALQKILNNLLSNAYKFTPAGGQVKFFATQRYVADTSVVMHFEVSDTGIGISEEFVHKIFEPYTQELVSESNNATGTGLGMAICKNMVDMQGGNISASSNVGEGTKFVVDIPYLICNNIDEDQVVELDYSVLSGKRMMVVDDVAINTMITRKLLEKYGVIVECAENGKAAVDMFSENGKYYYDCILMDIQMPIMDGYAAAAKIRSGKTDYAENIPVIAMTADAFLNDSGNAVRDNFDGYIFKPVSPDKLYEKLILLFTERADS